MPTPLQVGQVMMWDGSLWVNAAIGTAARTFDVKLYGAKGDGTTDDTEAIQDAIDACATDGGGVVFFPPGTYPVDSDTVAASQGPALLVTTGQDNVTLRGSGRGITIIKPASNKIAILTQNGGNDLTVEDMTFDNSSNGLLQNQTKVLTNPLGGIAGYGNQCNSAIRQMRGTNLTVRRCDFSTFVTCIHYIGDFDTDATLDGIVTVEDVFYDASCFGLLTEQPEEVYVRGSRSRNTVVNANASSDDPGHNVYVASATGAQPRVVQVYGVYGEGDHSSPLKIRKGEMVTVSDFAAHSCGRGLELINVRRGTASNIVVRLAASVSPADTQRSGLLLVNCDEVEVDGYVIDVSGADAYGIRVDDSGDGTTLNKNNRIGRGTVINDYSNGTGNAACLIDGQTDFVLEGFRFVHTGTTVTSPVRPAVDVRACTRARIRLPQRRSPDISGGNPADAARLVQFDASCVNCEIEYRAEDIDTTITSTTVNDGGTTTKIIRREHRRVSADKGNAAATLVAGVSERVQVWNTALTADRACALSVSGARDGDEFHIVRTAAATGAFNLNVGTGPLKALTAGQWCIVVYNGNTSAWMLSAFGSL